MKLVLSTKGTCPASGLTIYGQVVPAHQVNLQGLENGIIMGYCPHHQTRWFIGDRGMCFNLRENAQVIERLFKPEKGKVGQNGKTATEGRRPGRSGESPAAGGSRHRGS